MQIVTIKKKDMKNLILIRNRFPISSTILLASSTDRIDYVSKKFRVGYLTEIESLVWIGNSRLREIIVISQFLLFAS